MAVDDDEKKESKVKTFTDPDHTIKRLTVQIMKYWKENDRVVAPTTEGQFLALLLMNYKEYLDKHKPRNFDARNMLAV